MAKHESGGGEGATGPAEVESAAPTNTPGGTSGGSSQSPAARLLPSLTLPKGGGAIRGVGEKFSTNPATGTVSLSVPIATSPGRSGFELGLELGYDSGAGNGAFGVGWVLSTPSVSRKTDKGLPRYLDQSESDVFVLSGAEDLVPVRLPEDGHLDVFERSLSGKKFRVQRFRPRVEGLFGRVERWTHETTGDVHWRATTRDNVTNVYGESPAARVCDPDDPLHVFSWLLEETRDGRGNIVRYTYAAEDGSGVDPSRVSEGHRFAVAEDGTRTFRATAQRYLKRIQYGNAHPGIASDWLFELVFDYGEHDELAPTPDPTRPWPVRADPYSSYRACFEVRTYRLCRRALMFHRFAELGASPCLVGSTEFRYDQGEALTYLVAVTHAGYQRDGSGGYERTARPPLDLDYVRPEFHDEARRLEPASLEGIPGGLEEGRTRWVDLDGEGIPGLLVMTPRAWGYKSNLGQGRLGPPTTLRTLPSPAELTDGVQKLSDLSGDGQLDLVQYTPSPQGYFTRTWDGDWESFRVFDQLPNIDWKSENLRFVDVDGDGQPDLLITEHDAFVWYRSRAKEGFEAAERSPKPWDEGEGPAVVFADGTETIHLADVSGDGLMDIVRVRNGEVSYWPNLGYARFGRKVTLDNCPHFDVPDRFDPNRVRFADIDGSGTSDIIYLGADGVALYSNLAGNALSDPTVVRSLPPSDGFSSVDVVDLLGQGTTCLVWSSPLPANGASTVLYVDLMGGRKPHLLRSVRNNFGAETRIAYDSSTHHYLRDEAEGRPWLTRLPFPVQVASRIERVDLIARSRLVTRYRYHHGFFDGEEREFRGFACVEQWDAESFDGAKGEGLFADFPYEADPSDPALDLPPVRTVTWFHTGAWLDRERLELALEREYYDHDPLAPRLRDTVLPGELSTREQKEGARALRGRVLRQEVFAEDGTLHSIHPYSVSERSYEARLLQPVHGDAHAVFFVLPRERVELNYERDPEDPRVAHELNLEVDAFGNVTRSATVSYPRRHPTQPEQARPWVEIVDRSFTNRPDEPGWYRVGVPTESTVRELTAMPVSASQLSTVEELRGAFDDALEIAFEATPDGVTLQRRVIHRELTLYYADDLSGPLPLGQVESLALPYETYRQALTPGLVAEVFGEEVDGVMLESEGGYVLRDGVLWAPSGRGQHDPARFYLPVRAVDPFGNVYSVEYDSHALMVTEARDPVGNVTRAENDYRTLSPVLLTDPNENRTAVELDALGIVIKTAKMGKVGVGEGDTMADPTTRIEYDLDQFRNHGKPVFVRTFARERHGASNSRWQEVYSYTDGSGREVMRKIQAEPGPVPILDAQGHLLRNPDGTPQTHHVEARWVGSGRTVFDNKGNPIKKYEPFFSASADFQEEAELVEWGVTPVLRYDPLGRLVRTDLPNGTHTRVDFNAWSHTSWDENDSVAGTPWLGVMEAGSTAERRAAALALAHASTPTVTHLDPLGRVFLQVADNGPAGRLATRLELDAAGNQLSATDARGVVVERRRFDAMGRLIDSESADSGHRVVLSDVTEKPIRGWRDGRSLRTVYDALMRRTHLFVREEAGPERLLERVVYGESHPEAAERNLRGREFASFSGAGLLLADRYDLNGNLEATRRRLATSFPTADWSTLAAEVDALDVTAAAEPLLEPESYGVRHRYDALGRMEMKSTPDGSEIRCSYQGMSLVARVEVRLRGATSWTPVIEEVEYNARGDRVRVRGGDETTTTYELDPRSFRLQRLRVVRRTDDAVLQDLTHTYDAVGNVVEVTDAVSYANPAVSASQLFEHDATYRLVRARGREHPGQQPGSGDSALLRLAHPNDMTGLRRYEESYRYDDAGNLLQMKHRPVGATGGGWTRRYEYATDSNRLRRTSAPGDAPGTFSASYAHDAAGNITQMPHLPQLRWDYADRLVTAEQEGGGTSRCSYDAAGKRVRKQWTHSGLVEEWVYLDGYEVYRRVRASDSRLLTERKTLHVAGGWPTSTALRDEEAMSRSGDAPGEDGDDGESTSDAAESGSSGQSDLAESPQAFIEITTIVDGNTLVAPGALWRFQHRTRLGTCHIECAPDGGVLSYEEHHPYGSTAFRAADSVLDHNPKRYRFAGKERDRDTGLVYFGARYYVPWLGRWLSSDPAGLAGGSNAFVYAGNSPTSRHDPEGYRDDLPGDRISPSALAPLQLAEAGGLPILTTVRASPTLRPREVERAAATGRLTNFRTHPGSSFLGAVGEALIIHNLRNMSTGLFGSISTFVVPQPGSSALPSWARAAVGSQLPDLLVTQVGFRGRLWPVRFEQRVQWRNTIGPGTGGRVTTVDHGPRTVVSLMEVTTSTRFRHLLTRATRVAAWARAIGSGQGGGVRRAAVLAMDRAAFFRLSAAERTRLVNTVTHAGGFISLFRDLTSTAVADARALSGAMAPVSRP